MKKVLLGLLAMGLTAQVAAQVVKTEELSEVTVMAANYKYLKDVKSQEVASVPVQMLERKVAGFDPTSSDFYLDEYDRYNIAFFIPEGRILAAYDNEGKLLRTVERYKNIKIPNAVRTSVLERFPGWTISDDIYRVSYTDTKGAKKTYKLTLKNGDKTVKVKMDEDGVFL